MSTLSNLRHIAAKGEPEDSSKPLGLQVVTSFLSIVENPTCHCDHVDNFFKSYYLVKSCMNKILVYYGQYMMATPQRVIFKNCWKRKTDFLDFFSNNYVSIVQWKDNEVVYIGSNFNHIEFNKMVETLQWAWKEKAWLPSTMLFLPI